MSPEYADMVNQSIFTMSGRHMTTVHTYSERNLLTSGAICFPKVFLCIVTGYTKHVYKEY